MEIVLKMFFSSLFNVAWTIYIYTHTIMHVIHVTIVTIYI